MTQIYLCRENQFLAAHCSESHHLTQYAETGKAYARSKPFLIVAISFASTIGCFEFSVAVSNKDIQIVVLLRNIFGGFVFFMDYKYEPLLMERFSTHCCLIPVFSTPQNTFGCRADEAQSFCLCFMICQYCKMETKVNWSHQHFYSQRYN